jgi:large subunit ribosomal protein L6
MSNIAKKPIVLANGATAILANDTVTIEGPKGKSAYNLPAGISATLKDGQICVSCGGTKDRKVIALSGLARAVLANMATGVTAGFEKKLELAGVGYRAQMQAGNLVLSLGFSHPVTFPPMTGVSVDVKDNVITVSGSDKALVGLAASKIRAARPPEPYKGKGIKYKGEKIRRKAGKAAKAGAK